MSTVLRAHCGLSLNHGLGKRALRGRERPWFVTADTTVSDENLRIALHPEYRGNLYIQEMTTWHVQQAAGEAVSGSVDEALSLDLALFPAPILHLK